MQVRIHAFARIVTFLTAIMAFETNVALAQKPQASRPLQSPSEDELLYPKEFLPPAPSPAGPAGIDSLGDPLPPGAICRFGTSRFQHGGGIAGIGFMPDAKHLVTISKTQEGLRVWNALTGQEVGRLSGRVSSAAFARDGSIITAYGGQLRLWFPFKGNEIRQFPADTISEKIVQLAVHPDCRLLAVSTIGKLCLIDLGTGRPRAELKLPVEQPALRMHFSPDGRWLAASGLKTGVWLWDLKNAQKSENVHNV